MICQNCGEREAFSKWGGENYCGLCVARNGGADRLPDWCELCIVKAQITFVTRIASELPDLQKRFHELVAAEAPHG